MTKDRFVTSPYPDVQVTEDQRFQLIDLVDGFVQHHFQSYEEFVTVYKRKVDKERWKHVKSKDNLRVYSERSRKTNATSTSNFESWNPGNTNAETTLKRDLPVVQCVGTIPGKLDDVMFGAITPTQDVLRIKASYVQDYDDAAILCSVVEPSEDEPFCTLTIQWMTIDLPLQATTIVKKRDFVYIEATGIMNFTNGERVGYYLLHSIEFPQTKPLPNVIRGNYSMCGFFRQIGENDVDAFACGTLDPGGDIKRFLLIPSVAEALLSVTKWVYCGQMKKMSWMLKHGTPKRQNQLNGGKCVTCTKKISGGAIGAVGRSTCKLCYGSVCFKCKIRKRISFITLDGQLTQRKMSFCVKCLNKANKFDAMKAAKEHARNREIYKTSAHFSDSDSIDNSNDEIVKPYEDLEISEEEQQQLIDLVDGFVATHFEEYEDFVIVNKSQVDENRWKHVKSKDNQHVYAERPRTENIERVTRAMSWDPSAPKDDKDLPVVLSVGTLVGDVDDVMFGVVNPTLDVMRIKASYVHDLDSAAVLCSVVEPSVEKPFRSLVIKWMTIDLPLQSTNLVKSRDFVYIEATGIVHFANGERVGYHLLHSIEFPQTKPLSNMIRGNLSVFGFFRQIEQNAIDIYASGTVAPGGKIARFLSIQVAAEALLSATNYVHCGQMKKLSWMLQHRHSAVERQNQMHREKCVVCERKVTKGLRGFIGASTCKLCYGCVCFSCKVRKRISFIALDNQLIRRKISFCTKCVSEATKWDAKEAARDQATGYEAYKEFSTSSQSDTRSTEELSLFD
ncbi:hypothetical protein PHMEG_00015843 [Phytophthora megakarya]|uniref:FYVE-type domain-containing protein n=1 Tax=Phytophthora megakarya TaxID=4795 RepID=A0A225W0Q4_9STRA|nr:hypothetical protein PHMEG_00015843 [Phytophthora megakarya]